jgi:hypothetical protein
MLKSTYARALSKYIREILKQTPPPEDVNIIFDMDALSFF